MKTVAFDERRPDPVPMKDRLQRLLDGRSTGTGRTGYNNDGVLFGHEPGLSLDSALLLKPDCNRSAYS